MTLTELISHAGLSIVTFAITNADDLLLLSAWFAGFRASTRQIIAGQYLGICFLIAVSLSGIILGEILPPRYISFLGLVPIFLGFKALINHYRGKADDDNSIEKRSIHPMSVALVTIANGGDNIGVYTPLFATLKVEIIALYCTSFLVLTGVWCYLGFRLTDHPRVRAIFTRYQHIALPVFLIVLGLWILFG
jgi:cadmium resistance protein CadD (predicted permease)